ncbi:MAG TPA: UpxY family transcription antiterminator [Salinivirgaceae bacterium]|nr:UpxY family transcription antiterminator [Salinivirgaceae bacterium]HQA76494.1 UpxY family transcription antiterminator [Salinivirgaceae bacterium]
MSSSLRWYAVSTRSRHEKKVALQLAEKGIEAYLPLYRTVRQWSDRKKIVEVPLITCYVFVRIDYKDYLKVLKTDGVVRFLMFQNQPAYVQDREIENLRILTKNSENVKVQDIDYQIGDYIEINSGPFCGFKGEIIRKKSNQILVVRLDFMSTMICVEISSKYL